MRIAVTCGPTSQGFLPPIERLLREGGHEVRRFTGKRAIDFTSDVFEWKADAIWHEWADTLARDIALVWPRQTYVRCHRYDVSSEAFKLIRWSPRCRPIITSQHIIERALVARPDCGPILSTSVVDFDAFPLQPRVTTEELRIAVVGFIDGRKQPGLALAAAWELSGEWSIDCSLDFIGGPKPSEPWWKDYIENATKDSSVTTRVLPWTDDPASIWKDHDLCLVASADEGLPYNAIEAMASGVPTYVNEYVGARAQFPDDFVWSGAGDFAHRVAEQRADGWSPERIRAWAEARYSIAANRDAILNLFKEIR